MIKIKKIRQIDVLFLGVFIAYLFDIGDIKYVLAFAFMGLYIFLMALYKRSLPVDGPGKPFITITLGVAANASARTPSMDPALPSSTASPL